MKKRKGFVSNSSSSSFIIKKGRNFKNSNEIAKYMLGCIDWLESKKLTEFHKIIDSVDDVSFHFETTNEDTWIHKIDDFYYIETCNNHDWGDLHESNDVPDNLKDKIGYDYCELEYSDIDLYESDFCSLPFDGFFVKRTHWDTGNWDDRYCKEHHRDMQNIMGKFLCPVCGDLTVVDRKRKLEKIFKDK